MLRSFRLPIVALASVLAAYGCGRSHDLGVDPSTSSGSGGATTTSSSSRSSSSHAASSSSSGGTGGGEPVGPTALTIVNGINDYAAVRFCFLPNETPWPSAPAGLAFGAAQVADLTSALPMGSDVTVWVLAGKLGAVAGMTCSQILGITPPADGGPPGDGGTGGSAGTGGSVATGGSSANGGSGTGGAASDAGPPADAGSMDAGAPPPVIATQLVNIPASVLTSGKSLLFVPTGCLGGSGHDASGDTSGCGMGYSSTTPTAGAVLLAMSRVKDPKHLSLQFASASAALQNTDFRVLPTTSMNELNVAPGVTPGGIGPYPPFAALAVADYGLLGGVQLKTYPTGSSTTSSSVMLSSVLSASGFGMTDFVNGASFVFVAIGGAPGASAGPFWHPFGYALVKADPG